MAKDETGDKAARKKAADKLDKDSAKANKTNKSSAKGGKDADKDTRNALRRLLGG
jgi:hypothetical protein